MRRQRTSKDVLKIGDGHGCGTGDGGVRRKAGQSDFGIVLDFGNGTLANDPFDFVEQGLACLGNDVSQHDMRRIEGVDDVDRAVSDISCDFGSQFRGRLVSRGSFGEQCGARLCVGHGFASWDNAWLLVEPLVNRIGRAVTFETPVIAAIAGFAIDVNGDVSDFGGRAMRPVIDRTVIDDAKADAFAKQIVSERSFGRLRVEQELCQGSCTCVLFHEYGHIEGFAEFLDEIDFAPALHGGDECGMPFFDKVRPGTAMPTATIFSSSAMR